MAENEMKFCVVLFKIDNSVEVVPIKWLESSDGENYCKFPPTNSNNRSKLCSNPESKPRKCWSSYAVNVVKQYVDYSRAVKRAKKYIENTDVDTTDVEQTRLRKRRKIEPPVVLRPPQLSLEPTLVSVAAENGSVILPGGTFPTSDYVEYPENADFISESCANQQNISSTEEYDEHNGVRETVNEKFQNEVLLKLAMLESEQKDIKTLLLRVLANQAPAPISSTNDFPVLPITNEDELNLLETWLNTTTNFDKLVSGLSKIGGHGTPGVTYNILKYLIGTSFSARLRFTGSSGKRAFGSTKSAQLIRESVRNFLQQTIADTEINIYIGRWLRNSGDRGGGRKRRVKLNGNPPNDSAETGSP